MGKMRGEGDVKLGRRKGGKSVDVLPLPSKEMQVMGRKVESVAALSITDG